MSDSESYLHQPEPKNLPKTLWQVFTTAAWSYKNQFWTALPIIFLLLLLDIGSTSLYQTQIDPQAFHSFSKGFMAWFFIFSQFIFAHRSTEFAFFGLVYLLKLLLNGSLIFQYNSAFQKLMGQPSPRGLFGLFRALKKLPLAIIASILAMILIGISMIFSLHPGIILMIYFSMIAPVVFLEGRNPIQTLKISACLVHRHFWKAVLVTFIITGLILGFSGLWENHHSTLWVRGIFAILDLLAIGFFSAVSVTFYRYLSHRLANPLRQKFYQLLKNRPSCVRWAAGLTLVYALVTLASFALLALQLRHYAAMDENTFYALVDSLVATDLILGLSIIFMAFAYFGGPIARVCMMIVCVLVSLLFIAHLTMVFVDFDRAYFYGFVLYSHVLCPAISLILNISIFGLLARAGAWYRELKKINLDQDLEALRTEINN